MGKRVKERGNVFFRMLDRYVGIPLIGFLSLYRNKKRKKPGKFNRIAIIKMGAIGDSILTLPFIKKLRHSCGDVKITVICGKNNYSVYKKVLDDDQIDQVIFVEFKRLICDAPYLYRKIKEICAEHYDYSIDFDSWYRISALISSLVKADYKLGFKKEKQFKDRLFDQSVEHLNTCHEFENYQHLAEPVMGPVQEFPVYPISEEDAIFYEEFMAAWEDQKYIIFHPWASGYKNTRKELDRSAMVYIGNKLAAHGFKIIITGGKPDREKSDTLSALIKNSVSLAGKTSLDETAVFLKHAHSVVTVNTGTMHLAAAVGSTIVSINGPTDINRWGPLSKKAINIKSTLFCSPCLDLGFEYKCAEHGVPPGHCMQKINLDEVVSAAVKTAEYRGHTSHIHS